MTFSYCTRITLGCKEIGEYLVIQLIQWIRQEKDYKTLSGALRQKKADYTFLQVQTHVNGSRERGAGMAQWWEHSSSTNVARDRFSDSTQYVGWVCCWFSSLLREVFLRVLRFPPLLKNQHFQILIRSRIQWTNSHSVEVPLENSKIQKNSNSKINGTFWLAVIKGPKMSNGTLSNALTFSHRAPGQYYGGRRFIFFLGLPIFLLFLLFLQPLPISLFFDIGAFNKLMTI